MQFRSPVVVAIAPINIEGIAITMQPIEAMNDKAWA